MPAVGIVPGSEARVVAAARAVDDQKGRNAVFFEPLEPQVRFAGEEFLFLCCVGDGVAALKVDDGTVGGNGARFALLLSDDVI